MARKRRSGEVFSMSFLDCMSCGFGAVILFFMIINSHSDITTDQTDALQAETDKLEIEVLEGRKDLRELMTFTVDGYDAKDYDDALSLEVLSGGGFRLYVHIADVSHYIKPETALDAEAFRRSTSIYPVDRVVPMLPEKLSNNMCSLKPNEDRLAMTVEMDITRSGQVRSRSAIGSKRG